MSLLLSYPAVARTDPIFCLPATTSKPPVYDSLPPSIERAEIRSQNAATAAYGAATNPSHAQEQS